MRREKPRAAPLALGLTEAVDRICGVIEMMCSISHPNELYYIIGHIVINQKQYPVRHPECNLCPKANGLYLMLYCGTVSALSMDMLHQ